jgi:hypothetical protein
MYIIVSIISAILAAAIMTYISLATALGPWIESTLVMMAVACIHLFSGISEDKAKELLSCIAVSGGIAGIAATACAFAYPTLFFLNPVTFRAWLTQPFSFISSLFLLILIAGLVAFVLVEWYGHALLTRDKLPFPLAQLVNKIIVSSDSFAQSVQLVIGSACAFFVNLFYYINRSIPKDFTLFQGYSTAYFAVPRVMVRMDSALMLFALGFVTGHMIAVPLLAGIFAKSFLVLPLNKMFFLSVLPENMILGWCAGMAVYGAASMIFGALKGIKWTSLGIFKKKALSNDLGVYHALFFGLITSCAVMFFFHFGFSTAATLFVFLGALVASYQVVLIAGEMGIAPLGRFATFVMLPGLVLFHFTDLQTTIVATFVELCCGIAASIMSGRKIQMLNGVDKKKIIVAQVVGLVTAALVISILLWRLSLVTGLGQPPLIAQKAYTRALLVKSHEFNGFVMILGMIFSWLLQKLKINAVLVISGLVMPFEYIIPLVVGGTTSLFIVHRENYYPFWSGVFAMASLLMLMKLIL